MKTASLPSHHPHDAEVAARFDATQARFKTVLPVDDVRFDGVIRVLGSVRTLRILDLGCGKGRFASPLADRGAEVVGVDLSQAMLASAQGINRARASARRLPFADATFDAVIAVEVLEHVGAVAPVLREAFRMLRPGGHLIIIDKNLLAIDAHRPWVPSAVIKWIDQRRGRWMYPHDGPVRERWFVPALLRSEIANAGFVRAQFESLLTPSESRRWIHRTIPLTRLMTLWSAQVPGAAAVNRGGTPRCN